MNSYNLSNDRINLKAMITLFKAHQSLTEVIKDDIREYDFDLNEFAVYEVVYHYKQLRVSEINDKVLVNSSSLTYILDKLVRKNIIERLQDEDDRRVFNIRITKEGKLLGNRIFPSHYELLTKVFNVLTEDERELLSSLLKKVGFSAKEIGNEL